MALQHIGVGVSPDQLNHLLSEEDGAYADDPDNCDGHLEGFSYVRKVISDTYGVNVRAVPIYTVADAKAAIRQEEMPVVMRHSSYPHFLLAVDVAQINGAETIGINDPQHIWPRGVKHRTTLRDGFGGASGVHYVERTSDPPTPSLTLYAMGVEMLLTDGSGNRVGYHSGSGTFVHEIDGSMYYDTEIVPPGSTSDGITERILYLSENAGGEYSLEIIGSAALAIQSVPEFQINVIGFDDQLQPTERTISGSLAPGATEAFYIVFRPGEELLIGQRVYLPLVLRGQQ